MNSNKKSAEKCLKSLRILMSQSKLHLQYDFNFSVSMDKRTNKIKLNYSVPDEGELRGSNFVITKTKQKQKYITDYTVHDYKAFFNSITYYLNEISEDIKVNGLRVRNEMGDGIEFWMTKFLDIYRSPPGKLSQASIDSDRTVLNNLLKYLNATKPHIKLISDYNNIVHTEFIIYESRRGLSDSTVKTTHIRIKSFFNWIKTQYYGFNVELYLNRPYKKKINTDSFTQMEIKQIQLFIDNHRYEEEWGWFIEILIVLLETGCRIGECLNSRVKDFDSAHRTLKLYGKGNKVRIVYARSNNSGYVFHSRIYINGIKKDNENYIFHQLYYRKYRQKGGVVSKKFENLEKPYSRSGVEHKFKKMVKKLNLNNKLSPHCCRRFFITEMLKATNGDIPLVAELVGHSSWDMVKHYTQSVVNTDSIVNVDFEKLRPRFSITK